MTVEVIRVYMASVNAITTGAFPFPTTFSTLSHTHLLLLITIFKPPRQPAPCISDLNRRFDPLKEVVVSVAVVGGRGGIIIAIGR